VALQPPRHKGDASHERAFGCVEGRLTYKELAA
jgi:hypothetical protein